jgi:hypothetical protein
MIFKTSSSSVVVVVVVAVPICSFVRCLFVCSFVRLFVCSFVRSADFYNCYVPSHPCMYVVRSSLVLACSFIFVCLLFVVRLTTSPTMADCCVPPHPRSFICLFVIHSSSVSVNVRTIEACETFGGIDNIILSTADT